MNKKILSLLVLGVSLIFSSIAFAVNDNDISLSFFNGIVGANRVKINYTYTDRNAKDFKGSHTMYNFLDGYNKTFKNTEEVDFNVLVYEWIFGERLVYIMHNKVVNSCLLGYNNVFVSLYGIAVSPGTKISKK